VVFGNGQEESGKMQFLIPKLWTVAVFLTELSEPTEPMKKCVRTKSEFPSQGAARSLT
jgi:hypothetical protein